MSQNGAKWIRRDKRLAIYLRDGLACVYCGRGVEDEVLLTLDHLRPRKHGGSNEATNLVTACHECNSARGAMDLCEFVQSDLRPAQIIGLASRAVPLEEARAIAKRGGYRQFAEIVQDVGRRRL